MSSWSCVYKHMTMCLQTLPLVWWYKRCGSKQTAKKGFIRQKSDLSSFIEAITLGLWWLLGLSPPPTLWFQIVSTDNAVSHLLWSTCPRLLNMNSPMLLSTEDEFISEGKGVFRNTLVGARQNGGGQKSFWVAQRGGTKKCSVVLGRGFKKFGPNWEYNEYSICH